MAYDVDLQEIALHVSGRVVKGYMSSYRLSELRSETFNPESIEKFDEFVKDLYVYDLQFSNSGLDSVVARPNLIRSNFAGIIFLVESIEDDLTEYGYLYLVDGDTTEYTTNFLTF